MGLLARFLARNSLSLAKSNDRDGSVSDTDLCGNKVDLSIFGATLACLYAIDNNKIGVRDRGSGSFGCGCAGGLVICVDSFGLWFMSGFSVAVKIKMGRRLCGNESFVKNGILKNLAARKW
jgi:hypothetical protein